MAHTKPDRRNVAGLVHDKERHTFVTVRLVVSYFSVEVDVVGQNKNLLNIKKSLGVPELDVLPYSSLKNEGRSELLDLVGRVLVE